VRISFLHITEKHNLKNKDKIIMQKVSIQSLALDYIERKNDFTFTKLIKRLKPGLFSFTYRILKDKTLCEDAINQTFVAIWAKIEQYNTDYNFSTWAYAIARNECYGLLKEKKKTVSLDQVSFHSMNKNFMYVNKVINPEIECVGPSGERLIETLYEASLTAISKLKEPYKTIATEREINQKQLNDIAENLGWNLNTVKTRLTKARKDIARIVEKEYPELVKEYLHPDNED
jgi:RNA polymerase sigma-70 factor, ECF subfamily